jgi:hypothetical protein
MKITHNALKDGRKKEIDDLDVIENNCTFMNVPDNNYRGTISILFNYNINRDHIFINISALSIRGLRAGFVGAR